MKGQYIISLLLPLIFVCGSCTQQSEKQGLPEKVSRDKPADPKRKPLKIIHLAGETINVNPKTGRLTIRGKDGDVKIYATDKTIVHIGGDSTRLSDITAGNKATVKYFRIDEKNIARSIFIVRENPDESKSPKAESPSFKPAETNTTDQPPEPPQKTWPAS
jgi:hypothetical protein